MCHSQCEIVGHSILRFQSLAAEKYLDWHIEVSTQHHLDLFKYYEIKVNAQYWYDHKPVRVIENNKMTVLWNYLIAMDRHIMCNKPRGTLAEYQETTTFMSYGDLQSSRQLIC